MKEDGLPMAVLPLGSMNHSTELLLLPFTTLLTLVRSKVAVLLTPHSDSEVPVAEGAALTVTCRVLALAHCPGFGVKVRVYVPLSPAGLKLLLLTPVPDHSPLMPLCTVDSATGSSLLQSGPTGVRAGVTGV
ncbi:MAG: hypothetical protein D6683_12090 [Actinomyces sp.]|nr:MAG: hypothetical protein D6683_12090 [Actinomyces sp.]